MTATAATKLSPDTAYESVRRQVMGLAFAHWRRVGGELEEWQAEANLGFVKALNSYDGRAKLTTWVQHVVRTHLLDRARWRRRMDRARIDMPDGERPARRPCPVRLLLSEMGEDARLVVHLIVQDGGRDARSVRTEMLRTLADLGWCGRRVLETMAEVREALT